MTAWRPLLVVAAAGCGLLMLAIAVSYGAQGGFGPADWLGAAAAGVLILTVGGTGLWAMTRPGGRPGPLGRRVASLAGGCGLTASGAISLYRLGSGGPDVNALYWSQVPMAVVALVVLLTGLGLLWRGLTGSPEVTATSRRR